MSKGRKIKLTPEIQSRIVDALSAGATYRLAASAGGIGVRTFYDWMNRGECERCGPYAEFAEAVHRAETESAVDCLRIIRSAAKVNWTAAAWLLERRHDYVKPDPNRGDEKTAEYQEALLDAIPRAIHSIALKNGLEGNICCSIGEAIHEAVIQAGKDCGIE